MSMRALRLDSWVESDIKKYAEWVYGTNHVDTFYLQKLREEANNVIRSETSSPKSQERAQWILKYFPDAMGY